MASHDQTTHSRDESAAVQLGSPIQYIPNVGPRREKLFARLGIRTVADLIKHLPHRWEYHAGQMSIGELPVGSIATAVGEVTTARYQKAQRRLGGPKGARGRFQITLEDRTHRLDVVWFNMAFLSNEIHPGMYLQVTGKVTTFNDYRQMVNPTWQVVEPEEWEKEAAEDEARLHAVYPATEDLSSRVIERIVEEVLPAAIPQIEDHFDAEFRSARAMPGLGQAYRMMHQPEHEDEVKSARRRLAYDELMLLQLGLAVRRHHMKHDLHAPALRWSKEIDGHIRARFSFELTKSQDAVVAELVTDLQRTEPMNRLVQGDVGSGKTIVALYGLLLATSTRKQGALMAPTELLAEQHYLSISDLLAGSNVRLALLTGSQTAAQREAMRTQIEADEVDIVIGTQALLTENVQFADLALVVVDEQHRFGVMQRAVMRTKAAEAGRVPHYLVMTATPIPRTLSMTLFGDLDISTIGELPPGRQPITTRVVGSEKMEEVYTYIAERVNGGEQAYVVVPAIEEGELNLRSVHSHARLLKEKWFGEKQVATLHGQLKADRRNHIMQRFREGRLDVLVATTVIEVGIDVPNASLMVIEHADRFGLAQLHQLRGRVGRGSRRSLCVMIGDAKTDDAAARLAAIEGSRDGFRIAEEDLRIRGMGEFFGTRQSGLPPLTVARIPEDMDLLQMARRDAEGIVESDPGLRDKGHELLRKRLVRQYGQAMGLGDVG